MLLQHEKFDSTELNKQVKKFWDLENLPIKYSSVDKQHSTALKIGITVNIFNEMSDEDMAKELIKGMKNLMESLSKEEFTAYVTIESVVMNNFIATPTETSYVTAYYTGDTHLNPPDIRAWFVMRGTFPDVPVKKNSFSYYDDTIIVINGERVEGKY